MTPCSFWSDSHVAANKQHCYAHGERNPVECAEELRRELGVALLRLGDLQKAVESFLYKANMTPPWESAGAIWGEMVQRLNNAWIDSKSGIERPIIADPLTERRSR